MNRLILATRTDSTDVENGADGTPVAFKIWPFGEVNTDMGVHKFTKRSAELLDAEQKTRGNLYSFDVDHLSFNDNAPPENRKAVGFHRLEVRADGLWAVDVDLADWVRKGMAQSPPEWRYFSPAYAVDSTTSEITSYQNTALTNNPATWSVTALATRGMKGKRMTYKEALAALESDDEDKKAEAKKAIRAAFGEPDGDDEAPKKEEPAKAAEGEPMEKMAEAPETGKAAECKTSEEKEGGDKMEKKEASRRLDALEAAERTRILASRKDLTKEFLSSVKDLPIDVLAHVVATAPGVVINPAAASQVQATRGVGQTGDGGINVRATRQSPEDHANMVARMGREAAPIAPRLEKDAFGGVTHVFRQLPQQAARQFAANHRLAKTQSLEGFEIPSDVGATFGGAK